MAENIENNKETENKDVKISDIFSGDFTQNPSADDIFGNSADIFSGKDDNQGPVSNSSSSNGSLRNKIIIFAAILMAVNVVVLAVVGSWVYFGISGENQCKNPEQGTVKQEISQQGTAEADNSALDNSSSSKADEKLNINSDANSPDAAFRGEFEGAASFQLGQKYMDSQDYHNAYLVFKKLKRNLTTNIVSEQYLSDYLHLKMALALSRGGSDNQIDINRYFQIAKDSSSPFVQAFAHYHLAFIYLRQGKYLDARQSIYKAIALEKCFEQYIDENFDSDCYFIASEALTKQVLALNNRSVDLPAEGWSDEFKFHRIVPVDQEQLRTILSAGVDKIAKGSVMPAVWSKKHPHAGIRYSSISVRAPVSEILEKLSSASNSNIRWNGDVKKDGSYEITEYLENITAELIAEISAGSAGLIARFDDKDIIVYNCRGYKSLGEQKKLLTQEAIVVWRRFLMRYRGDHRNANANYAKALMLDCAGYVDSAINSYVRISSRFSHNVLAPYALLNSSRLRTKLRDYTGAQQDLTQLVMEYRDSAIANQAYLDLARATMNSGLYNNAIRSFQRLYYTDFSDKLRAQAASGAGICHYRLKDYDQAEKWLSRCIEFDGKVDMDFTPIYYKLGQVKTELGLYAQAVTALKRSIRKNLPTQECVNILIQLALAQSKQGKYVDAINTIDNVSTEHLSQEMIVKTLLTESYILRSCQIPENAIAILRHRMAYLSDPDLRAKLLLELSKCYTQMGDHKGAKVELIKALKDLKPGDTAFMVKLELAKVSLKLEDFDKAIQLGTSLLKENPVDQNRSDVLSILGKAYSGMGSYDMAALAYADKIDTTGLIGYVPDGSKVSSLK